MPVTDTYIEKDAQINEEIDRLRHASTQALLTRKDVIIVASVSCIYGLGSPEDYARENLQISVGDTMTKTELMKKLIGNHFERTNADLSSGQFRALGNRVDVVPVSETFMYQVYFGQSNVNGQMSNVALPRPMLHSRDYDFSFSGLKTAVLYLVRDLGGIETIDGDLKNTIAREFEDAAVEVLVSKTLRAAKEYRAKNIIVGGGVSANKRLREVLQKEAKKLGIKAYFPTRKLSTDNSVMIGMAGYLEFLERKKKGHPLSSLKAQGNLEI